MASIGQFLGSSRADRWPTSARSPTSICMTI